MVSQYNRLPVPLLGLRLPPVTLLLPLYLPEMFFSMAAMTSSVTSVRSVSDLSDIELDSSVHSDYSACPLQPPSFAPGVRTHWGAG